MQKKYSDGARALIGTLLAAGALAFAAIVILIMNLIEPSSRKISYNVPEPIPTKIVSECKFERPLATIAIEGLGEWLETSTMNTICIKKKSEGFWFIYEFESKPDMLKARQSVN